VGETDETSSLSAAARMPITAESSGDALTLRLSGDWSIDHVADFERDLAVVAGKNAKRVRVDCSQLGAFDLSAAWLLREHLRRFEEQGADVEFTGKRPALLSFIDEFAAAEETAGATAEVKTPEPIEALMTRIGKFSVERTMRATNALSFCGRVVHTAIAAIPHPKRLRATSIVRHVYETGIQAIPIVALIAFLITLVIAYIGAQQLKRFGAEIFTVDLVTIGVLREMGVLLTAIIVAGRSGSAFAAEIGVMQLNDEVDALKSIGMDPYEVLVLPRVLGLVIALPLLTILADAMGLAGGALLCSWLLDISIPQFVSRLQDALAPTTFWAGFIKSPVFALLIAMTGTYRGMQVRDSSRELGRLTTVAVVQSIFLVILANAIFAIIYLEINF
jgi:phospholipid/cholesterol/gamma-HCH transport system permease protein